MTQRVKSIVSLILALGGAAAMYEYGIARNHRFISPLTDALLTLAFAAFVAFLIFMNIRSARH